VAVALMGLCCFPDKGGSYGWPETDWVGVCFL
jgi:hypothetical protein